MSDALADLDVFHGELTTARALVYARLPVSSPASGGRLSGELRGPFCRHAATLPVMLPLVDCGPGPTLLAKAAVPDPCFWTPDLPAIYEVTVRLERGDEVVATARRQIGLRPLGCLPHYFSLSGKPWVVRGVRARSASESNPRAWQEAAACLVTQDPSDEQLGEASRDGALAIVDLTARAASAGQQLRHLARFPAAAAAVLPEGATLSASEIAAAPNLLLAARASATFQTAPPWAKAVWATAEQVQSHSPEFSALRLPLIVERPLPAPLPLAEARSACDALQRDLAPLGQFAGYVV